LGSKVQFVLNGEQAGHADALLASIEGARHLDCMVAFAKGSALKLILKALEKSLERGMTARFAIGLSFHLTEPTLLRTLFKLSKNHPLELYLSDTKETFHPKVYAFADSGRSTVFVGSANLTAGGLSMNYEASVRVDDADGALAAEVAAHFEELIEAKVVVPATKGKIEKYAKEFAVQKAWHDMAKRRADKINRESVFDLSVLTYQLEEMKRDASESGFTAQRAIRARHVAKAKALIQELAALQRPTATTFLPMYEDLYHLFNSGGLHRQKSRMAARATRFVAALADILGRGKPPPAEAFEILRQHFLGIKGAGVNLLTEVLHAIDNKRYAVMNQNAVEGLATAGFKSYPLHPAKAGVDGELYARFCEEALTVRRQLGLANFSELDALFNYIYWQEDEYEEDA
jgi:HKD family nuclease